MKLWRVANRRFKALDGIGGLYVGGRWHTIGKPVVYTAEHPALAALEVLVNLDMELRDLPEFVLLELDVPAELAVDEIDCDLADRTITAKRGDEWLAAGTAAVCKVPSFILPKSFNFLLNPSHGDAKRIDIVAEEPFEFDSRLFPDG